LLSTPRWALADAPDPMDSDHGGVEDYLRGPAGLSDQVLDDLRHRLLR
jgi:Tyrosine phosphatase family